MFSKSFMILLGREDMAFAFFLCEKILYNSMECVWPFSGILHQGIHINSSLPENLSSHKIGDN